MSPFIDLAGQTFGQRLVIERVLPNCPRTANARWLVQCSCGREAVVRSYSLRAGKADMCRSCAASVENIAALPWSREPDDVVVDALAVGHRFTGQIGIERRAAAKRLLRTRPDLTLREIAETVGVCVRTVERAKARAAA